MHAAKPHRLKPLFINTLIACGAIATTADCAGNTGDDHRRAAVGHGNSSVGSATFREQAGRCKKCCAENGRASALDGGGERTRGSFFRK